MCAWHCYYIKYCRDVLHYHMFYCLFHVCPVVGDGAIPPLGWELRAQNRKVDGRKELLHCAMREEAVGYRHIILLQHEACDR
jgi:hypothetical protein